MRLHSAEHYSGLARIIRRTDMVDTEELVQHLNTIGYSAVDVVEMPGQYAVRGSLFDAYPPEADRPMRIELFGDEVESIRKFDPGTQRLLAKIGGSIHQDRKSGVFNKNGGAEPFIAGIFGQARLAFAGDRRNAGGSASSEKSEFHKSA